MVKNKKFFYCIKKKDRKETKSVSIFNGVHKKTNSAKASSNKIMFNVVFSQKKVLYSNKIAHFLLELLIW